MTQFLIPGPPSKKVIALVRSQNQALTREKNNLAEENARLKSERLELEKALSKQTEQAKAVGKSYEELKSGAEGYLELKASYEKATQELTARTKQVGELEKELASLRNSQTLHWFLGGAALRRILASILLLIEHGKTCQTQVDRMWGPWPLKDLKLE